MPRFISTENNIISHLNDNREFDLPRKGITNDKHAIIPKSPRTHQRLGRLDYHFSETFKPKRYIIHLCSKTSALKHLGMMC